MRTRKHCWIALALVAVATGGWAPSSVADLTLARDGRTGYQIVLSTTASPAERYAAEELQGYLKRITHASIPLVSDAQPGQGREILVGDSDRLRGLGLPIHLDRLGGDGFVIWTEGNRLVIAGGRPRGTLNGVYTLLEEQFGVRWFTPDVERVPEHRRLQLPAVRRTVIPKLEYREVYWTEFMQHPDFAARQRMNGASYGLTEKHGGRGAVYQPFVHSFDLLVPPELFATHPEYFPMINGERKSGYVQRCLTNPDVVRMAIDRVRQWIREHPDATIISVSQNDTFNNCQCPSCKAVDDAEGSPAGSLLQFVNAIADAIATEHPQVRIDTLAYQYTRKPPRTVRPRDNVIIRLCSIECCFAHPLATCPSAANRDFRRDLLAWKPVARTLYVWDYTPNFAHYQQPFPNWDVLQPNVEFLTHHGVSGLFEQGNYSPGGRGEMEPLRSYLLAKALWDPFTDLGRHRAEFLAAYYGRAGGRVGEYLDLVEMPVRNTDCHAHIFDSSKACYLTDDLVQKGNQLLAEAEQLADNGVIRERVAVARLPVWYVELSTRRVTGYERTQLLERFLEVARRAGISNISESKSLDQWAREMGAE